MGDINKDIIIGGIVGGVACTVISTIACFIPWVSRKHEESTADMLTPKKSSLSTLQSKTFAPHSLPLSLGKKIQYPCCSIVITSGQLGTNPQTSELESPNIEGQTQRTLENLKTVLVENGMSLSNVVRARVYLSSMDDYQEMNQVYETFFNDRGNLPARVVVAMSQLPKGGLVEIELEAVK